MVKAPAVPAGDVMVKDEDDGISSGALTGAIIGSIIGGLVVGYLAAWTMRKPKMMKK